MIPLVALIVSQPGMAGRLLAQHRDDGTGHCTTCQLGAQAGRYLALLDLHRRRRGNGGVRT